jgi:hypothetical protein
LALAVDGAVELSDAEGHKSEATVPPELLLKMLQCAIDKRMMPIVAIHDVTSLTGEGLSLWISLNDENPVDVSRYSSQELDTLYKSIFESIGAHLLHYASNDAVKKIILEGDGPINEYPNGTRNTHSVLEDIEPVQYPPNGLDRLVGELPAAPRGKRPRVGDNEQGDEGTPGVESLKAEPRAVLELAVPPCVDGVPITFGNLKIYAKSR